MKALLGPLLLIIGVAVGYGVGQVQSTDTPSSSTSETAVVSEDPDAEPTAAEGAESAPIGASGSEDGRIVPASASSSVTERDLVQTLLERVPEPVVAATDATISGYVFDARRVPVEGVRVTATVIGSLPGRERVNLHEADREEYAAYVVAEHRFRNNSKIVAYTDGDGRYELTELLDLSYRLSASKDGFRFDRRGSGWSARPGDAIDFLAHETLEVEFVLRLPDGTSPEEATVQLRSGSQRRSHSRGHQWTRDDPWCSVTRGSYEVYAEVDEDFRSEPIPLDLTSMTPSEPVTLELVTRRGIRGELLCDDPTLLSRAQVRYQRLAPGAGVDLQLLATVGERVRARDGRFSILDLEPGSYMVGAQLGNDRIDGSMVVEVADGIVEQDLTVQALTRDDVIVGWVRDERGEPLMDVRFRIRMEGPSGNRSTSSRSFPRDDGSAWLIPNEEYWAALEDPDTTVTVEVQHRELGSKKIVLTSNEFTADFRPPAFLTLTVGNYLGTAAEGMIEISLQKEQDFGMWAGSSGGSKIDSEGLLAFGPVEPGEYQLSVTMKMSADDWGGTSIDAVPVDLVSGQNSFNYSLPPLRSVEVRFPELEGKAQAMFTAIDGASGMGGGRPKNVGVDDPYVIPGIPEGEYVVMLMGREMTMMKLVVNGNVSVDYDAVPLNALKVQNASRSGLDELGFESGDLIIGIDGQTFDTGMALQMALMAAMNRPKLVLKIQRDGVKRDLEVSGTALQKAGRGGGVIPWSQELE